MKMLVLGSVSAFFLVSSAGAAENRSTTTMNNQSSSLSQGFVPFVTLGGGLTDFDQNADNDAPAATVKILGSFYSGLGIADAGRYVFDLGLGLHGQGFAQKLNTPDVRHNSLELAARYQWNNKWQAGALWNTHFDKGGLYGSSQGDAQFLGAQLLKEFLVSEHVLMRAGGHLMTGVNTVSVGATTLMLDLHLGWSKNEKKSEPVQIDTTAQAAPVRPAAIDLAPPAAATGLARAELAKDGLARFAVGSAELTVADRHRLSSLGKSLAANLSLFERIEVVGHTDVTGSEAQNKGLSVRRAQAVAEVLIGAGLPKDRISFVGKGSTQAVSNAKEKSLLSQDRRAGLKILGAHDGDKISNILQ